MVAPAGPVPGDRLRRGLDLLATRYRVRIADDILRTDGYLAGGDERRAEELSAALADPDVRAVLVARGGYGIMRILPRLDPAPLAADPKPIVGFSDATALLSWALHAGVRSVHGPVVCQLGELSAADQADFFAALEATDLPRPFTGLGRVGADGTGRRAGHLVGGNLSLVAHLHGTPWAVPASGAILFLEDVGERPYAIDRYLTRLLVGGGLAGARGVALGDFVRCDEHSMEHWPDAPAVLEERMRAAGLPGLAGLDLGHGTRNRPVPFGGRVVLDLDAGALELVDAAVA